jgi:hypothetical protein
MHDAAADNSRTSVVETDFANRRSVASTRGNDGGRYWDRTSDLFGVNEALSR